MDGFGRLGSVALPYPTWSSTFGSTLSLPRRRAWSSTAQAASRVKTTRMSGESTKPMRPGRVALTTDARRRLPLTEAVQSRPQLWCVALVQSLCPFVFVRTSLSLLLSARVDGGAVRAVRPLLVSTRHKMSRTCPLVSTARSRRKHTRRGHAGDTARGTRRPARPGSPSCGHLPILSHQHRLQQGQQGGQLGAAKTTP
jgi:hypothetical protein